MAASHCFYFSPETPYFPAKTFTHANMSVFPVGLLHGQPSILRPSVSAPGSSWGWTCLVSLVFAPHVPESSGTLCRCQCPAVEILNSVCFLWWAMLSLVWWIISGLCSKWKLFLGLLPCLSWDRSSMARCSESARVNGVGWWGFSRIWTKPSKAVRKTQTRAPWQYLNRHIHLKVGNCLKEHGLWCAEQCYFKNYWLHEKIQNKLQ